MGHVPQTFAQFVQSIAERYVSRSAVDVALFALGTRADSLWLSMPAEKKRGLINHFVRALRDVSVMVLTQLEHALLRAAGVSLTTTRSLVLKSAISLVAVRNQIQLSLTGLGVQWSEMMRFQSAIADITRHVLQHGGGSVELEEILSCLIVRIVTDQALEGTDGTDLRSLSFLANARNVIRDIRLSRLAHRLSIELRLERPLLQAV